MSTDLLNLMVDLATCRAKACELSDWAVESLVLGEDSKSLRLLASLQPGEENEAVSLFRKSLEEIDLKIPASRDLFAQYFERRRIIENPKSDTVTIAGIPFEGWIDYKNHCERCAFPRFYHGEYDAYFCPFCRLWMEGVCGDPNCDYCMSRPTAPPGVIDVNRTGFTGGTNV